MVALATIDLTTWDGWLTIAEHLCVIIPCIWLILLKSKDHVLLYILGQLNAVRKQVEPNTGSSLNDAVRRLKEATSNQDTVLADVQQHVQTMTKNQEVIKQTQATTREELEKKLDGQNDKLQELSNRLDRHIVHEAKNDIGKSDLAKQAAARLGISLKEFNSTDPTDPPEMFHRE